MNPDTNNYTPPIQSPAGPGRPTIPRLAIIIAGGVLVLIIVFVVSLFGHKTQPSSHGGSPSSTPTPTSTSNFSVVAPDTSSITTHTTSLEFNFNKPISPTNVAVTSSPHITTGAIASGQTLTVNLTPNTLKSTQKYTVTLQHVSSTTGQQLNNYAFSFTPTQATATFVGEDTLTTIGFSETQITDLNTYIGQFKPWATAVNLDGSTIKASQDKNNPFTNPPQFSFTINIDDASYKATTSFFDTAHLQLTINDITTGALLFKAGDPGSLNN